MKKENITEYLSSLDKFDVVEVMEKKNIAYKEIKKALDVLLATNKIKHIEGYNYEKIVRESFAKFQGADKLKVLYYCLKNNRFSPLEIMTKFDISFREADEILTWMEQEQYVTHGPNREAIITISQFQEYFPNEYTELRRKEIFDFIHKKVSPPKFDSTDDDDEDEDMYDDDDEDEEKEGIEGIGDYNIPLGNFRYEINRDLTLAYGSEKGEYDIKIEKLNLLFTYHKKGGISYLTDNGATLKGKELSLEQSQQFFSLFPHISLIDDQLRIEVGQVNEILSSLCDFYNAIKYLIDVIKI